MGKFLNDLFLEEGAIFVLWGSKPLSTFPLYLFRDEEMKNLYDQLSEEEKSQVTIIENYDLPSNWKKWEIFQKDLNIHQFALFLRETDNPKAPEICFVNLLQTALTLEDHHEIFTKTLGFNFESDQVVSEIQDPHSIFWNKVLQEPLLLGILYGFGKHNSLSFHWKHIKEGRINHALNFIFSDARKLGHTNLENFPLPIFASFINNDPIIEKYENERRMIKNHYKGKDFVQLTLEKLQE